MTNPLLDLSITWLLGWPLAITKGTESRPVRIFSVLLFILWVVLAFPVYLPPIIIGMVIEAILEVLR